MDVCNGVVLRCVELMGGTGAGWHRWARVAGMVLRLGMCAFVTFWVSDLFARGMDIRSVRSVRLARWVSERSLYED